VYLHTPAFVQEEKLALVSATTATVIAAAAVVVVVIALLISSVSLNCTPYCFWSTATYSQCCFRLQVSVLLSMHLSLLVNFQITVRVAVCPSKPAGRFTDCGVYCCLCIQACW